MIVGNLRKMAVTQAQGEPIRYALGLNEDWYPLNDYLGHFLTLHYEGLIHCIHCGRQTKRSFQQGYCYPCFQRLAECDLCIVKPERCHFDQGTCREPDWAMHHCMQPHVVYLANTSDLKVGITRQSQIPTRWIDQGAVQALPVFRVASRYQAGLLEVALARYVADRTDWRRMLKGSPEPIDLGTERDRLLALAAAEINELTIRFGAAAITPLDAACAEFAYPVLAYPGKISAFNLDKNPNAGGELRGIKGQYLIFDNGVLNVRKYGGYRIGFDG